MSQHGIPSLDLKLAIDGSDSGHVVRGERKQKKRTWRRVANHRGTHTCFVCGDAIARGREADELDAETGEWHHLIKRGYFPAPYEVNQGDYSDSARKSQHHLSNTVVLCSACHGTLESFSNGRPHIMSWLCRSITGMEIPLVLPSNSHVRDSQYRDWFRVQDHVRRTSDCRCEVCGHRRRELVTKQVYSGSEVLFDYVGPDVRVVHILPPYAAPELMHDPENLILLCWECLFGADEQRSGDDSSTRSGWKDKSPDDWEQTFAPHLRRELSSETMND